jgi:hypothetical protein
MRSAVSALSASVDLIVTLVALIGFFLMLMIGRLSIRRIQARRWWPQERPRRVVCRAVCGGYKDIFISLIAFWPRPC